MTLGIQNKNKYIQLRTTNKEESSNNYFKEKNVSTKIFSVVCKKSL